MSSGDSPDKLEDELEDMFALLDQLQTFKTKGNIYRDCSDGVLVARLVHALAPRLVDLHSYTPGSGRAAKLANWMLFESKVLRRLGVRMSTEMMNRLVDGCPGDLENLLRQLQPAIKRFLTRPDEKAAAQAQADAEALALFGVPPLGQQPRDGAGEAAHGQGQGMGQAVTVCVPLSALRRVRRDMQRKDEEISKLLAKEQHLHRLLDLREQRVEDLQAEVQRLRHRLDPASAPPPPPPSQHSPYAALQAFSRRP